MATAAIATPTLIAFPLTNSFSTLSNTTSAITNDNNIDITALKTRLQTGNRKTKPPGPLSALTPYEIAYQSKKLSLESRKLDIATLPVGTIAYLNDSNNRLSPIKCVSRECKHQHLISDGAFDHPVVVLHLWKDAGGKDMALVVASSSNPRPDMKRPLRSCPISRVPMCEAEKYYADHPQIEDLMFLENLQVGQKQAYVLTDHVYAVPLENMSEFWNRGRSEFRLEKDSYDDLMDKLSIPAARWVDTAYYKEGGKVGPSSQLPIGVPRPRADVRSNNSWRSPSPPRQQQQKLRALTTVSWR
ncbi:hypothetical protein G7Y89_g15479 [Cudoniella acicularis]|uniref:Uncharacterized protein n=1 Tax=Cudoniella acicularis TaxID=354080 RepID=A0A8H4VKY1_9HELO|nr:hypothetical protein G7Y89_g15479 [Cudoniella acicularis]